MNFSKNPIYCLSDKLCSYYRYEVINIFELTLYLGKCTRYPPPLFPLPYDSFHGMKELPQGVWTLMTQTPCMLYYILKYPSYVSSFSVQILFVITIHRVAD